MGILGRRDLKKFRVRVTRVFGWDFVAHVGGEVLTLVDSVRRHLSLYWHHLTLV